MTPDEDALPRSVAPQDARSIESARQASEAELRQARDDLEERTHQLARSLALMRATLEATSDGILVTDKARRVTGFNRQYVAMWALDEAILRDPAQTHPSPDSVRCLVDPDTFLARIDAIYATMPDEAIDVLEFADGRIVERISRIQSMDGAVVGRVWSFRDITVRRRAEAALHRQSEWLRVTLASIGDGVIAADAQGRVTFLNGVAEELTGWTLDAATGQPVAEVFVIVNERTREPVDNPVARALREGVIVGLANSTLLIGRDGTERPIDDSAAPMRDETGRIIGAVLVFRDITERQRADEVRVALAAIVESSEDAIVSKGLDGVIRSWNTGAERVFGYTAAEAVGQPITMIIPPELIDEERTILARLRRGERIEHFETVRVAKDGRRIDISLMISPVRDSEGHIIGASKIARDITEFKRAKDILAWDAQLLANVRDAVVVAGFDGVVTYWNEGARRLFGWTADEVTGRHVSRLFPDSARDEFVRALGLREGSLEWSGEFHAQRKDGSHVWIDARVSPCVDALGRPMGLLGLAHDIDERRRAEEALRDADRRKDEFLALLAHELRNPLAPLRNGLQVMRLAAGNAAAMEQARAMMDRQLGHMVRLVDDLLDLSRIGQNKIELRRARIQLAEVIENAVETARPAIEAAGHALSIELPASGALLEADLTRLAQVFSNLLTNSAKYTERGGHIRVSAHTEGSEVEVAVRDDGIGIPAEALPHVFDMFSQVDRTIERTSGGLGIGLALVKGLVEMHGGSVRVESAGAGKGSTFTVRLPLATGIAPDEPAGPRAELQAAATTRRVLVVDDNEDAARSLARVLALKGHVVETAHDGVEALAAAERFAPEVVLMDMGMPRMNGYEAVRRLREQPWGRSPLVIAVTGWGQEGDRVQSREAGCDAHLVKPVDLAVLDVLLAQTPPAETAP